MFLYLMVPVWICVGETSHPVVRLISKRANFMFSFACVPPAVTEMCNFTSVRHQIETHERGTELPLHFLSRPWCPKPDFEVNCSEPDHELIKIPSFSLMTEHLPPMLCHLDRIITPDQHHSSISNIQHLLQKVSQAAWRINHQTLIVGAAKPTQYNDWDV